MLTLPREDDRFSLDHLIAGHTSTTVKILGIPIKVALAVFLGLGRARDLTLIAEWCAVVFASVLVHEFGHALAARAFDLMR